MASKQTPWGRRVRAALALTGRNMDEVAEELNISRKTLERTMRGERVPREWETRRLAEVLDVPGWFLDEGLDGQKTAAEAEQALADRLDRLEGLLTGIAADVADVKRRQEGGV